MKRTPLVRKAPMKRGKRLLSRARPRRRAKLRAGHDAAMLRACRGERCYLALPDVCRGRHETVVPAHANWAAYGKGMGIKADDRYTVPACQDCHAELDQGKLYRRDEKRSYWEAAYQAWEPVRSKKLGGENAVPAADTENAGKENARVLGVSAPRRASTESSK